MLIVVCAWCDWRLFGVRIPHVLGIKRAKVWGVSHGICPRCMARELARLG